jgi:inner membrane protein
MATILTHAVVATAIGSLFPRRVLPRSLWVAGALCSAIPDADVVGFAFGVRYGDFWGHRGFTHSLAFAAILAAGLTATVFLRRSHRAVILTYLFLATASHGLLDALTDGGLGVASISPFDDTRYFLPVHPIRVSPIGAGFFSERGLAVLANEASWLWAPSLAVILVAAWLQRRRPDGAVATIPKDAA